MGKRYLRRHSHRLKTGVGLLKLIFFNLFFVLSFLASGSLLAENTNKDISLIDQQGKVQVTGRVTDNHGESLVGVNVIESGTMNGTVTDVDGNYSLILTTSNPTLHVSYIGFSSQIVSVDGKSVVNGNYTGTPVIDREP